MAEPVTIVTPVYNGEAYIEQTVQSVLEQAYPALEYVVVDDGSTDDTRRILSRYASRIRILSQPNRGEPAAVNAGVAAATNDIVAIVNADDPILPGLVETAADELAANGKLVAVYPDWQCIDEHGKVTATFRTPDYDYARMLEEHYCMPGPGTFFRRSAFAGEPVRSTAFPLNGDFESWLRLGLRGPMRRIPRVLASWRRHAAGTSMRNRSSQMAAARVRLVESLFERNDLPASVRALRAQAISGAYYYAAILGLYDPKVPARTYLWRSLRARWFWPARISVDRRRSWKLMLYLALLPLSRPVKPVYAKLLHARGIENDLVS